MHLLFGMRDDGRGVKNELPAELIADRAVGRRGGIPLDRGKSRRSKGNALVFLHWMGVLGPAALRILDGMSGTRAVPLRRVAA